MARKVSKRERRERRRGRRRVATHEIGGERGGEREGREGGERVNLCPCVFASRERGRVALCPLSSPVSVHSTLFHCTLVSCMEIARERRAAGVCSSLSLSIRCAFSACLSDRKCALDTGRHGRDGGEKGGSTHQQMMNAIYAERIEDRWTE